MRNRVMFVLGGLLLGVMFAGLGLRGASAEVVLNLPDDFKKLAGVILPGDGVIGAPLAYADNLDGTFTDMATGRQWEKKGVGSGTCTGALHDVDATCNWTDATGAWIAAINAEGGMGLGGHSDWRVPTVKELQDLIDYSSTTSPVVSASFPGLVAASFYWSSTPFATDASVAWGVNFANGGVDADSKTIDIRVRAVRGGP